MDLISKSISNILKTAQTRLSSNLSWAGQQAQQNIVKPVQQAATSVGNTIGQGINQYDQTLTRLSQNPNPLVNFMPKAITSAANANIKYNQAVQSKPVTLSRQGVSNYVDQQKLKLVALAKTASPVLDVALAPSVGAATYIGSGAIGGLFGAGSQIYDNVTNKRNPLANVAQSAGYGVQQGLVQAPKISAISEISNPMIAQTAGKVLSKFPQLGTVGQNIVNRVVQGSLSVPQGMAMAKATGQDYKLINAALDFAMGSGLAKKVGKTAVEGPYSNGESGMVGNPRYIHPDDYKLYDQANTIIHEKGKFSPAEIAKAADDLRLIGEKYLPVADQPASGNPVLIANRLTKRMADGALPTSGDVGAVKLDENIGGKAKTNNTYKVARYGGKIDTVKGEPIKIADGIETFLHKDINDNWVVSEATTGRSLTEGGFKNENQAIKAAKTAIDDVGIEVTKARIAQLVEQRKIVKLEIKNANDVGAGLTPEQAKQQFRDKWNSAYGKEPQTINEPIGIQGKSQMGAADQTITNTEGSPIKTPIKSKGQSPTIYDQNTATGEKSSPGSLSQSSGGLPQTSEKISPQIQTEQKGIRKPPGSVLDVSSQPYFNTNRLNVDEKSREMVAQAVNDLKPAIETRVGKKLTNKEVVEVANRSARVLNNVVDRQQTLDWEAALLKTRQKLAAMSQSGTVDQEYLDTLMALKSSSSDIARKLQSFSIGADPKMVTAKEAILESVLKTEKDTAKVLEAANGVNFQDFKQATEFYRKFVKPTASDWLTTLRYNSMLSSPNTHINNAVSNFQGTGIITPVEKTLTGIVDKIVSGVTGKPRQYLTGEGAAYAKGYYSNVKNAAKSFVDVMSGNKMIENADIREIPMATKGLPAAVEKGLALPMKLLEASDQFFTALTEGGSKAAQEYKSSRGIKVNDPVAAAQNEAAKRLFRSELGDNSGSVLLDSVDVLANTVQRLKNSNNPIVSNIAKFTLPFVRTPTNILKQGIEYSPLGVGTLPGSSKKIEQLSKTILGSSVAAATALLVSTDRLTWAEPTSEKQKQMFRAAGMQPYSVKIGDTWVSYSKLHPAVSFNMALVAAVKNSLDNKKINDSEANTVLNGLAKWLNFYVDQSYMKNVGDFVAGVKGDVEGMAKIPANYVQQTIPYRALLGWITRLTDPYQRKVDPDGSILDKQLQQIATQIPLLSQSVPARLDQNGNPIENQSRFLNAISPARISTEKQPQKLEYVDYMDQLKVKRNEQDVRDSVKKTGAGQKISDVYIIPQEDGSTKRIDLGSAIVKPAFSGNIDLDKIAMAKYKSQLTKRANDIQDLYANKLITLDEAMKQIAAVKTEAEHIKTATAKQKKIKMKSIKVKKVKMTKLKMSKFKTKKIKSPKIKTMKAPKWKQIKAKI